MIVIEAPTVTVVLTVTRIWRSTNRALVALLFTQAGYRLFILFDRDAEVLLDRRLTIVKTLLLKILRSPRLTSLAHARAACATLSTATAVRHEAEPIDWKLALALGTHLDLRHVTVN
jgi:hypothetical protein